VADAAAAALLECAGRHCQIWTRGAWASVHAKALAYVLDLPFARLSQGAVVRLIPFCFLPHGFGPGWQACCIALPNPACTHLLSLLQQCKYRQDPPLAVV
jgi:hypothetical protein